MLTNEHPSHEIWLQQIMMLLLASTAVDGRLFTLWHWCWKSCFWSQFFLRWSTHDLSTLGGTDLAETDAALITGPSKCSLWVDIGSSINLRLVFPTPWQIPWQAGSTMLKWTAILRGTTTLVYGLSNDLEALNTSYQIPQRCSSPFLPCMGTVLPSSPPAHLLSLTL